MIKEELLSSRRSSYLFAEELTIMSERSSYRDYTHKSSLTAQSKAAQKPRSEVRPRAIEFIGDRASALEAKSRVTAM
jgi:hypothetical protein